MQLTIEIPDDLAQRAESERERLIELVKRTLAQRVPAGRGLLQEVFLFLSGNPSPEEIVAYRPPEKASQRLSELLDKNRESTLTEEEKAELETMQSLNHLFALVKLQARQQLRRAS